MSELKPCPFCGGRARLSMRQMGFIGQNYLGDKKIYMGAQVICNRCKARGPLYGGVVVNPYGEKKDASFEWMTREAEEAWNRRTGV